MSTFIVYSLDSLHVSYPKLQGPVVQSIVSLSMLLNRQLVKYKLNTYANTPLFFVGKCENLTFFQQKITVYLQ